jgi:hypothetical protein
MGMMRAGGTSNSTAAMMDMMMDSADRKAYATFMRMRGEMMKALGDVMIRHAEMVERESK